jgi:general secretion pathway protein G
MDFASSLRRGTGVPPVKANTAGTAVPRCRAATGALGFSLLEMMAVVNLILLLAVFALPGFHSVMVHSHEVVLREELFALRNQIDRFTNDYERGPTSLDELVEKEYMGAVPVDPLTGSNQTWQVHTETAPVSLDGSAPVGIVDVHSGAEGVALDGTAYGSW